jgi:hypothetical protein
MNLENFIYRHGSNYKVFKKTIGQDKYDLGDINLVVATFLQKSYKLPKGKLKNVAELVGQFLIKNHSLNCFESCQYKLLKDIAYEICASGGKSLAEIKIDIGNLHNVGICLNNNGLNTNLYVAHVINSYYTTLNKKLESTPLIARRGLDEFSIFVSYNSKYPLIQAVKNSEKHLLEIAKKTNLTQVKHSKANRPGGVKNKVSIYQVKNTNQTKLLFTESNIKGGVKNYAIHPEKVNLRTPHLLQKSVVVKTKTQHKNTLIPFTLDAEKTDSLQSWKRKVLDVSYTPNNNVVSTKLTSIRLRLQHFDTPFDIIKTHNEYIQDIDLIKHTKTATHLVVTIKWLNWAGLLGLVEEPKVNKINKWIQKNVVEGVYQDKYLYTKCNFYNDYGRLRVIIFNCNLKEIEEIDNRMQNAVNLVGNYVNETPLKYVITTPEEITFREVINTRDKNLKGIKIDYKKVLL